MPRAFTPEESAQIRAALLDAGRELLDRTGFRRTTVDALVRRAGISKGSFYLFFDSKEALWMALLQGAEQDMRAALERIVADPQREPADTLRALLRALFDAVLHAPLLRALADPADMAWLLRALPPETFEQARRDDDRFFGMLYRRLRRRGAIGRGVAARTFVLLPAAALALVQGRALIGEEAFATFVDFEIEAWVARLAPSTLHAVPLQPRSR